MTVYFYDGPVMRYGKVVNPRWRAETMAESVAKAKSNLAYRYRKEMGLAKNVPVTFPREIQIVC